jgi:hypothetical protein
MNAFRDWDGLRRALRDLHRALAERAARDYVWSQERIDPLSRGELLQLLATDPEFAWLRGLSELMVDIDEADDAGPAEKEEFALGVRAAVERFIVPPAGGSAQDAFAQRYWPYVQEDPHVAMAHAAAKRQLSAWPQAKS